MIQINLSHVNYCDVHDKLDAIDIIPAMQRRRLSSLAKIALNNVIKTKQNCAINYIVWVSQYGEEDKTLKILNDVLQDQTPSPTQFSTSVHNAISGLYSILCGDNMPATSLAGSWNDGLIEAYAWLRTSPQSDAQVMLVYYEAPLPDVYKESQVFDSFSLSAVVGLAQPNLELNAYAFTGEGDYFKQAKQFLNFWQSDQKQFKVWSKC
mgnify:FL=1